MTPTGPLPESNIPASFEANASQADVHCLCVIPR